MPHLSFSASSVLDYIKYILGILIVNMALFMRWVPFVLLSCFHFFKKSFSLFVLPDSGTDAKPGIKPACGQICIRKDSGSATGIFY